MRVKIPCKDGATQTQYINPASLPRLRAKYGDSLEVLEPSLFPMRSPSQQTITDYAR